MDTIPKVGAIGSGYWGPNLIRNFIEMPDCELRAIADLSPSRLEAMTTRYPSVQTTTWPRAIVVPIRRAVPEPPLRRKATTLTCS